MPVLQFDEQQFTLHDGATRIGTGADADIPIGGDVDGIAAVVDGGASPVIRRASRNADVRVNGVALGMEPTPLMHGDAVQIGAATLRYADDAKAGATQFVSSSDMALLAGTRRAGAARATAASGGRLVSLVDGKEYSVPEAGLVIGRDATADVVVAQHEVSRRHAEVAADEQGYLVRDTSSNGVFVNGERVQGSQRLSRADVLRIGSEEFRFYADLAKAAPVVAAPAASAPAMAAPAVAPVLDPLLHDAPTTRMAASIEDTRPVLATLESLNEGPGKGSRQEVRVPLAHVGRGPHNDVVLSDESVSESHAKLQRRDNGWYVVDMASTNGTYVGGTRVTGERRLDGSPDVRFGGVKMRFTALGADSDAEVETKGTRAIAAVDISRVTTAAPLPPDDAARESEPVPVLEKHGGGMPLWLWVVVVMVLVAVAFFVLRRAA